ncbi:MAG: Inositol 2-dehydrogenase/D-chiro-inositol 3-dehydrogenase [Verrucomicrobiae bacterium]|nr:Inositol 2-dehydrogenase/D-chiro-inositol 3-dehydrogenase [Verrucomicrobiae bacterium]
MNLMNVGMVGVMNFGRVRRSRLRETGLFRVAVVCDRNPAWLATAAGEENAQPYSDFDALLKHPGLEGIVISTGADSHAALSVAALRAGLPVFVEKPLCTSVAEIAELRRVQRETGLAVGVGHNHCPSDNLLQLARDYITTGKLGVVAAYEENSSHSGGLEIKPGDWRGLADRNPGGMLFQCGVHALHRLNWLFGPVTAVQAMLRYDANPVTQTADVANVLLRHESGLVGTLNCYHVTAYCHELRIFGTAGNLYLDTHTGTAWFQERRRGATEERVPVSIQTHTPHAGDLSLTEWHRAIRSGQPNYPGLADGAYAVLPVFAAVLAAKNRREMLLQELENKA